MEYNRELGLGFLLGTGYCPRWQEAVLRVSDDSLLTTQDAT